MDKKVRKYIKWGVIATVGFYILIALFFPRQKEPSRSDTVKTENQYSSSQQDEVEKNGKQNDSITTHEGIYSYIQDLLEDYDTEVSIWSEDNQGLNDTPPYEVIVNFPLNNIMDCNNAKKSSYYIIETIYEDANIAPVISRVLVSIPYSLRVSLGAIDGLPLAEKGNFSGPTNFWTVMENYPTEKESGALENRTWGVLLDRCN